MVASPGLNAVAHTVTIANGASLSDAADLGDARLVAIQMPDTWTAADLTFQVSFDDTTYYDLYSSTEEYSISADASRVILVTLQDWLAFRFLKVRSGASASAVNQAAEREIVLHAVS